MENVIARSRFYGLLITIVLLLSFIMIAPLCALEADMEEPVFVYLNGLQLWFDQPPILEGGRVMVPLRVIFEALGARVSYDDVSRKITAVRGADTIELTVDSQDAFKNGVLKKLDVPAKVVGGRTLVPVRFVSEAMGAVVSWKDEERKVIISAADIPELKAPTFKDPIADSYFERVILSKLIMGPKGPISFIPGSKFTAADTTNIDFTVKAAVPPDLKVTRRVIARNNNKIIYEDKQELNLRPGGNGFSFPNPGITGVYDLEVYSGGKLMLVLPFEVVQ